ncbi:MAG: hypothetical protein QOJ76_1421 [Acidobacteriota bacterium]|jgi:hypothetical protein|nr:hypothetical protein [Acidobacteriota bacterium]
MSTYEDKELTCSDCNGKFLWSAREQEFYAEKGFQQPSRCKPCRDAKKAQRGERGQGEGGGNRR